MKVYFAAVMMSASSIGWAVPPSESLLNSCLQARPVAPSVTIKNISVDEVLQEDDYVDGFNARYLFKYEGADIGYAEEKSEQALIYYGRLYRLSGAIPIGNNGGVKPAAFNPSLAQWSLAKDGKYRYLCVSFNFDGLGQSGSFQKVRGGYFLNLGDKGFYFAVRNAG